MDGNMIKPVGLIALGGVIGGVIGYFLGNIIIEELYRKQLYEEVDEEEEEQRAPHSSEEPPVVYNHDPNKKLKDYTKFSKGDLSDLVKPYTSSIEEISESTAVLTTKGSEKITIITSEEFENNRAFNKEPITYYENDVTFADVQEGIIDDPVRLFGPNIHLHFGEGNDDPDIVYVRNENTGVDYEISRVHKSYSVTVMGMPEEPPKPKRKRTRKVSAHDDEGDEDDESED